VRCSGRSREIQEGRSREDTRRFGKDRERSDERETVEIFAPEKCLVINNYCLFLSFTYKLNSWSTCNALVIKEKYSSVINEMKIILKKKEQKEK
jgi:hypothetical protein